MNKRKWLLLGILIILVLIAVMLPLSKYLDTLVDTLVELGAEPEYNELKRFNTEEPDWETNILEDEEYLSLNRKIYFSNGSETFELKPGDTYVPASAHIFEGYLDAIIRGEREEVNSYYTEEFIEGIKTEENKAEEERHPFYRSVTSDFTMQRVYDITLTFLGMPVDEDTGEQYHYYRLEYKISLNSGTFLDIVGENYGGHDLSVPQYIKVVERDGGYKIASIGFSIPKEFE